jgi:C4-dicarboxylate transporter DctQ subunit
MLDRALTYSEQFIITLGLAAATLLMFANVVLRYGFESGLPWALEATEYLFAWVVLIGTAHGVRAGNHLGIDILVRKLSPRNARRVALAGALVCLAFVISMFALSIEYIVKLYGWGDLTEDLYLPAGLLGMEADHEIPQWIPYLALPVGLGLMIIRFLQLLWGLWTASVDTLAVSERAQYEHKTKDQELFPE